MRDPVCHEGVLHLDRGTSVCEAEPSTELLRGLVGRPSVKRHERARTAGRFCDLRAPFVETDGGYLDAVLAAIDDLFEVMHGHGQPPCILASAAGGASESNIEGAPTCSIAPGS
jgi:hypothetical protein